MATGRCESREFDLASTSQMRLLHERDNLRGACTGSLLHAKRWALTFAVAAVTASIAVLLTYTIEQRNSSWSSPSSIKGALRSVISIQTIQISSPHKSWTGE